MTNQTNTKIEKLVEHPLENALGIEPGTTLITRDEITTKISKPIEYDEKDNEIEEGYQKIHDKALTGFEILQDELDSAEGRAIPRLAEVSVQMLNTALDAMKQKAKLKEHKDKLIRKTSNGPNNVTNNTTVIMNREDLLRDILKKDAPIEATFTEIGNNNDKE